MDMKRKAQDETAPSNEKKRTLRRQSHGTLQSGMSECLDCQELPNSSQSGQRTVSSHRFSIEQLKEGSANGCQSCSIIIEASGIFLRASERNYLQQVWISSGENGLWQLWLWRRFDSRRGLSPIKLFEIFTLPGVKAVWPKVPIGHIRQTYTGSKVYLDYLLPWTKTCAAEHPICRNDHESFIPRRVLDVGGDDGSQVRLLETQAAEKSERYICLSHMWGTSKPIQTTQSNMADHIAGIPLMALPLTFRDAVKITRYLGVRFLWIDSLCIVQDDNDDWVTQSAQMANIYGKSFLTISATISEDAHGGIFKRIPHDAGHIEVPHHVNLKESTGVFVGSVISHEQFENLTPSALAGQCQKWDSQYPLLGRAWAYQEQVLSPRVIFFGHHEIFWQCNVTSWCCCSPYPVQHALKHTIAHALDTGTTRSTKTNLDILLCWAQIVRSYCEKSITKEEDRLPALSGIAKRFQSVRNSRYLAGLWEDNLITDLCWVAGKLSRRPRKYLAPSWSWCSVFGWTTSNYALEIGGDDLTVREVSCTPSTSDPTGAVSSGFIRLSGFLLQGKAVIPSNDTSPTFRVQGMENEFYPDALNDDLAAIQASNYTVYGLKICYETSMPDLPMLCVLVLLKKDRSEDQYQRVGLASLPIDTWDNKFEKKCTITII